MARAHWRTHLPRRDQVRTQTAFDYRRLHRLSSRASSKPYSGHPHYAAINCPAVKTRGAALGCRVKSGRAVFVLIEGSICAPHLSQSGMINLSDPLNPETRQPYHAAMGKLQTNAAALKRRIQSVRRATE